MKYRYYTTDYKLNQVGCCIQAKGIDFLGQHVTSLQDPHTTISKAPIPPPPSPYYLQLQVPLHGTNNAHNARKFKESQYLLQGNY